MAAQPWHSIFVPSNDHARVTTAFMDALIEKGYKRYDPYPGGTGLSFGWKRQNKQFASPTAAGWTHLVGEPDVDALPLVAAKLETSFIYLWLDESNAGLAVITADGMVETTEALIPWLRDDLSRLALEQAWSGQDLAPEEESDEPQLMAVPLPADFADMAGNVDPKKAEKLVNRVQKSMMGSGSKQDEAKAMLGGESIWNSEEGRRLRAITACLTLPDNWRKPTHAQLQGAYQVARSRKHNPDGLNLPGDDEALAAVPNALDFALVYAGLR